MSTLVSSHAICSFGKSGLIHLRSLQGFIAQVWPARECVSLTGPARWAQGQDTPPQAHELSTTQGDVGSQSSLSQPTFTLHRPYITQYKGPPTTTPLLRAKSPVCLIYWFAISLARPTHERKYVLKCFRTSPCPSHCLSVRADPRGTAGKWVGLAS